jgi:hypothetical protein
MPTNYSGRLTVILLVLLAALWALFPRLDFSRPDLKPGIDMVGGTKLIYEIKPPEGGRTSDTLAEEVATSLKRRVDPQGLLNLIWRPQSGTRLEIQMPLSASSADSAPKRQAFASAQEELERTNVRSATVLRAVEKLTGDERRQESDAYFELEVYLWQAEDEVSALRELPSTPENLAKLAEASQAWMALRNELATMEEQAFRSDPSAENARNEIAAVMDAQRIAITRFERERDHVPEIQAALAALAQEQSQLGTIDRDLTNAESAHSAAQAELARLYANANAARDTVARADFDIARLRNAVDCAYREAHDARGDLDRAAHEIAVAQNERDSAAAQLRQLIEADEHARGEEKHRRDDEEKHRKELADRDREAREQKEREEASREGRGQDEQQARADAEKRQRERDEARRREIEADRAQQASAKQESDAKESEARRRERETQEHDARKAAADRDREQRKEAQHAKVDADQQKRSEDQARAEAGEKKRNDEQQARAAAEQRQRDRDAERQRKVDEDSAQQARVREESQARQKQRDDDGRKSREASAARERDEQRQRDDDRRAEEDRRNQDDGKVRNDNDDSGDRGSRYKRKS